jgi:hypothetical protein
MLARVSDPTLPVLERNWTSADCVNQVFKWLDTDSRLTDSRDLFYFLHVNELHFPYAPPMPGELDTDSELLREYYNQYARLPSYIDAVESEPPEIDPELREKLLAYCHESAAYIAEQLQRLVADLKHRGLFDESLIVIAGDHGEEFLERGFYGHQSLYDANLRPGMIVKPPADSDITNRDAVDLIDIYPTIARAVRGDVPDHCQGRELQAEPDTDHVRITQRLSGDGYTIAVSQGDAKAIFTYPENYPDRPTDQQIADGPILTEYHRLSAVRTGGYDDKRVELSEETKATLKAAAEEFMAGQTTTTRAEIQRGHQRVQCRPRALQRYGIHRLTAARRSQTPATSVAAVLPTSGIIGGRVKSSGTATPVSISDAMVRRSPRRQQTVQQRRVNSFKS